MRKLFLCILIITLVMGCYGNVLADVASSETHVGLTYAYKILEDGTAEIVKSYGYFYNDLIIPSELDGIKVTRVADDVYSSWNVFTSVTIPESITYLGARNFDRCKNLNYVVILSDDIEFGPWAFSRCYKLSFFVVSSENPNFYTIDGVLFNKTDKSLVYYPMGKTDDKYEVPQGILKIRHGAFSGSEYLSSIVLPDSVVYVDDFAFNECSNLLSITIPESLASIGKGIFVECKALTEMAVSQDNPVYATIDGVLFDKSEKSLVRYPSGKLDTDYVIPQGIEHINGYAFSGCENLHNVVIPDSVISIDDAAFESFYGLNSLIIPDSVVIVGGYAFWGCYNLSNIKLSNNLKSIGEDAFSHCRSLSSILIPASVSEIGNHAFPSSDGFQLIVYRGSYAEQYCKENNLNYTYAEVPDWLNP